MADIFVGYASQDVERVRPLVRLMSAQGWSVWWDHKIPIGKSFDVVIETELARAGCVVAIWSKASVHSGWVKNEAAEGMQRGILVPAVIDEVTIPFEFRRVETARLQDWDFQSTSHPELIEFFNAIGEIIQRPWSLDGKREAAGHAEGPTEAEEPQGPPANAAADVPSPRPESDGQRERQLRASKLLAHWFARSLIPDTVFHEAIPLAYRVPASDQDERRMKLLDLCGKEDGALFTRAWRALDASPEPRQSPVERFEAFLTRHLLDGDFPEPVYRDAMAALGHEPRDEREARRHDVLTRFAAGDAWDISLFSVLWNEMEEDAAPEPHPEDVPVDPANVPLQTDPAPGPELGIVGRSGGDDEDPPVQQAKPKAPPAGQSGNTAPAHGANPTVSTAADGRTQKATQERTPLAPQPPWYEQDRRPSEADRWNGRLAIGIVVASVIGFLSIPDPWHRTDDPLATDTALTTGVTTAPPVTIDTPVVSAPALFAPTVFLDSIRTQLATGRQKHDDGEYVAAAEEFDTALGRLRSRAAELPEGPRRALEDSLITLRAYTDTACTTQNSLSRDKKEPCPQ